MKHAEISADDYKPYGVEWEKELMKLNKKQLIALLRKIAINNDCQKK